MFIEASIKIIDNPPIAPKTANTVTDRYSPKGAPNATITGAICNHSRPHNTPENGSINFLDLETRSTVQALSTAYEQETENFNTRTKYKSSPL